MDEAPQFKRSTWVAIALLLALYTALSLHSSRTPTAKGLGAALSIGPVLLIALIVLWRSLSTVLAAALTALLAALLYREWAVLERHYEWSDLVQQVLVYALIATSFALSLRPARVPLCTQLAQKLHGALGAREIAYLRRATAAWASFYALICAAIIVLFLTAPLRVWSLFVNVLVFAVIALACVADHLVRRRVLPPRATGG